MYSFKKIVHEKVLFVLTKDVSLHSDIVMSFSEMACLFSF